MSLLEHPEAQVLLAEAEVSAGQVLDCQDRLSEFLQRYLPLFYRTEQRELARCVIEGRLSGLQRKTSEPIALAAGRHRKPVQNFLGAGKWDDAAVLRELRRHVAAEMGTEQGVLVVDATAFVKKGTQSCGVARQWCGRLGKMENCQVGVFLSYQSTADPVLVDAKLYLPLNWAQDRARREKTHVPPEVIFQEKWKMALDLIDRSAHQLPHRWITADDDYGRCSTFRSELRFRKEQYVLEVPCNTSVRPLLGHHQGVQDFTRADAWAVAQPKSRWKTRRWRDGEKGPMRVQVLRQRVQTRDADRYPGPSETLLVIRTTEENPRTWYTLSNAGRETKTCDLLEGFARRPGIEQAFQTGKSEVGLSHYEVRSWVGWHHHDALSLLAAWFVTLEALRIEKKRQR